MSGSRPTSITPAGLNDPRRYLPEADAQAVVAFYYHLRLVHDERARFKQCEERRDLLARSLPTVEFVYGAYDIALMASTRYRSLHVAYGVHTLLRPNAGNADDAAAAAAWSTFWKNGILSSRHLSALRSIERAWSTAIVDFYALPSISFNLLDRLRTAAIGWPWRVFVQRINEILLDRQGLVEKRG